MLLGHKCIKHLLLRSVHLYELHAKSVTFRPSDGSQPDGKGRFHVRQRDLKLEILSLQDFLGTLD
jgi:hypothetical protein